MGREQRWSLYQTRKEVTWDGPPKGELRIGVRDVFAQQVCREELRENLESSVPSSSKDDFKIGPLDKSKLRANLVLNIPILIKSAIFELNVAEITEFAFNYFNRACLWMNRQK